jgi:anti-sigma factor ChrR (cupin superfamily)
MSTREKDNESIDIALAMAMGEAIEPYELSQQQRNSMKSRILRRIQEPPPEGTSTLRYTEGEWFDLTPLIEKKVLYFDQQTRRETSLWRLQPGAEFQSHVHSGVEECTVLEGDVTFGNHLLRKGDFHMANTATEHPPSFSRLGALLLISAPEADAIGPAG